MFLGRLWSFFFNGRPSYHLQSEDTNLFNKYKIFKSVCPAENNKLYELPKKYYKQLLVINTLYEQQQGMYDQKTDRWPDRIISISQPHIRPIVRGKQGKRVEFGSKLGVSLSNGYVKADTLSWDAYNEAADLPIQAEAYKSLYGYYPELIQVEKIYGTNANRTWCRERNIRLTVTPKGKQKELTAYQKLLC